MPTVGTGQNTYLKKEGLEFRTGETVHASLLYDPNASADKINMSGVFNITTGSFTISGNPVVTGTSAEDSDTLQTVTDRGNTTITGVTIGSSRSPYTAADGNGGERKLFIDGGDLSIEGGKYIALDMNYRVHGYLRYNEGLSERKFEHYGYYGHTLSTRSKSNALVIRGDVPRIGFGESDPMSELHLYSHGVSGAAIMTIQNGATDEGSWGGIQFINSSVDTPRSAIFSQRTGGAYNADLTFHATIANEIAGAAYPAASERMRIKSDGKVGIGTNDPNRLLHLYNNTATVVNNAQLRIDNAGGGDAYIYMYAGSDWSMGIDNSNDDTFKICNSNDVSDGTEVLEIDRDGNVGIGTDPRVPLDVNGEIRNLAKISRNYRANMGTTTLYVGTVYLYGNGDSAGFRIKIYDGAEKVWRLIHVTVQNSGGTNYPSVTVEGGGEDTEVHIDLLYKNRGDNSNKTDFFLDPTASKSFTQLIYVEGYIETDTGYDDTSATSVDLDTDIALYQTDKADGSNVGIGTVNPAAKLDVKGDVLINGGDTDKGLYITRQGNTNESLKIYSNDYGAVFTVTQDESSAGYGNMTFQADADHSHGYFGYEIGGVEKMRLTNTELKVNGSISGLYITGGTGIFTSSTIGNVEIFGSAIYVGEVRTNSLSDKASNGNAQINFGGASKYIDFETNATSRMFLGSDGNLGLGASQTTPDYLLDLYGGDAANKPLIKLGGAQGLNEYVGILFGYSNATTYNKGAIYYVNKDGSYARGELHFCLDGAADDGSAGTGDSKMMISHDGNVAIGTQNPAVNLDIYDGSAWAELNLDGANGGEIKFQKAGTTYLDIYASDSTASNIKSQSDLRLSSNNSVAANRSLWLDSDGNVGIGTDDPEAKLEINAPSAASIFLRSSDSNPTESCRIRLAEEFSTYQGGFIHYDGSANVLNIGMHPTSDETIGNDINAISIARADGKVGIGVTNPTTQLQVNGSGYISGNLGVATAVSSTYKLSVGGTSYFTDTSYWSSFGVISWSNHGGVDFWGTRAAPSKDLMLASNADWTNGIIVKTDGDVGIGTVTPSGTLHVYTADAGGHIPTNSSHDDLIIENNGNCGIQFSSPASSYQYLAFGDTASANQGYVRYYHDNNTMTLRAGGTDTMTLKAGNVGIGTDNPSFKLDVQTSAGGAIARFKDSDSSHEGIIIQGDTNGGSITNAAGFSKEVIYMQNSANAIRFYTDGTEAVRIDSSQRVGIGTNSVNGFTHINGRMLVESPTVPSTLAISDSGDATKNLRLGYEPTWDVGCISASDYGAGWKDIVIAPHAGSVGIGTTNPPHTLSVKGTISRLNSSSIQVVNLGVSSEAGQVLVKNAGGVDKALINSNGVSYLNGGNVGIGTIDPQTTLDIVGDLKIGNGSRIYEKAFYPITFTNGVANQKVDLYWTGTQVFWGEISVTITSTYANQNSAGIVKKKFFVGLNASNSIFTNDSRIVEADGDMPDNFTISDLRWDATNSRYYITIVHRVSTGNTVGIKFEAFSKDYAHSDNIDDITAGSVYTTDTTAYNKPYVYYNDRVGIGTTNPDRFLTIDAGGEYPLKVNSTQDYMMGLARGGTEQWWFKVNSAGDFTIHENAADDRFRIKTGGNVGIGTDNPAAKLDVWGAPNTNQMFLRDSSDGDYTHNFWVDSAGHGHISMYQEGNSQAVSISTAGHSYFNGGRVGIGTATPYGTLAVFSANNTVPDPDDADTYHLHLHNPLDDTSESIGIAFGITSDHDAVGAAIAHERKGSNSYGDLYFSTRPIGGSVTERVRITSAGNVGIGTDTAPEPLTVKGSIVATNTSNVTIGGITYSSNDGRLFASQSDGTAKVLLDSDGDSYLNGGDVGIGTNAPAAKLDIFGDNSSNAFNIIQGGEAAFRFSTYIEPTSTNTPVFRQGIYYNTTENATIAYCRGGSSVGGFLTFQTNTGAERMRIDSAGNVGVGTDDPSTKLEVAGDIFINGGAAGGRSLQLKRTGASKTWKLIQGHTSTNDLEILEDTDTRLMIKAGGDVGIGLQAPSEALDVVGYLQMANTRADSTQKISRMFVPEYNNSHGSFLAFMGTANVDSNFVSYGGGTASADAATILAFYTAAAVNTTVGTERMRIDAAGNVGIGTVDPEADLDVDGVVKHKAYAFSSLPTKVAGMRAFINDSYYPLTTHVGQQAANGGSYFVPVWTDGAYWYYG